jgi:hypothetical protein
MIRKLLIGATPTPHGEILEVAKEVLAEKVMNWKLKSLPNMHNSIRHWTGRFGCQLFPASAVFG